MIALTKDQFQLVVNTLLELPAKQSFKLLTSLSKAPTVEIETDVKSENKPTTDEPRTEQPTAEVSE